MKLSIDIEARFAQFNDSLNKIDRDVNRAAKRMSNSFGALKGVVAGFIGTFAGLATVGGIKSIINDLDKLNTVSERSGIAAKDLNGLAFAATQTGTDLEVMAKSLNKLNIALSELAGGKNKELKDILTQLGLPEFAKGTIDAQEALLQLAEVFPRLSEADQARVALLAFGKAGQEMIPALKGGRKELEDFIKTGNKLFPVTNELAKSADDFNDAMSKAGLAIKGILLGAIEDVLPFLTRLAEGLVNANIAGFGFFDSLGLLFRGTPSTGYGDQIKALTKQIEDAEKAAKSAKTSFLGIKTGPADATDIGTLKRQREFFKAQQRADALLLGKGVQSNEGRVSVPGQLELKPEPKKDKTSRSNKPERDDSARRLLEQQLQNFERTIDREKDAASDRNEFLEQSFRDGLTSLSDFTEGRKRILAESVRNETEALDSQIALLEKSKSGQKADDQIQTDTKINVLIEKRSKLLEDAAVESIRLSLDGKRDADDYARSLAEINAQLLEMQGNLGEAAKIRFGQQNKTQRVLLKTEEESAQRRVNTTPEGPSQDLALNDLKQAQAALEKLDALEKNIVALAEVNRLEEVASRIRQTASEAEERAALAAQAGTISEMDSLRQINEIRLQEVEALTGIAGLYDDIAKASADKRITQGAKSMRLEIEKLAASADLVREKFQGAFTSAFGSFFDKLTSGTVSLKDALRALVRDMISNLAKLGQENFINKIFAKDGAAGGASTILSQLFGSNVSQKPAPVSEGVATSTGGFFTQAAAPVAEAAASSFGSAAKASAGAEAAAALTEVATSSTATSYALKEFADGGVATATEQVFQSVAAGSVQQTAEQSATSSLAFLAIAVDLATEAMLKQAASASVSGAVQSSAGGFAEGGQITGAGTGTSDSIPILASHEEFMVQAKSVKQPGALKFLERFNKVGMAALKVQRFATGGLVRNISQVANSFSTGSPQMMAMAGGGGGVNLTQNFTVEARTPTETQQQMASAAYQGGMRAYRRNR